MEMILTLLLFACFLGMAKVTGPLFSISASGKIADAMVHFPWKGRAIVRKWLKPSNPQSGDQGDRRVMLGGLGRAPKYVQTDSLYYDYAKEVEPEGQTWLSYFVSYIMATYFTNVAGYIAKYDEYMAHPAKADWDTRAAALGLVIFDLPYRAMSNAMPGGGLLYMVANFGCDQYLLDNSKFLTAPYTKTLATWVDADIVLMVADFSV